MFFTVLPEPEPAAEPAIPPPAPPAPATAAPMLMAVMRPVSCAVISMPPAEAMLEPSTYALTSFSMSLVETAVPNEPAAPPPAPPAPEPASPPPTARMVLVSVARSFTSPLARVVTVLPPVM